MKRLVFVIMITLFWAAFASAQNTVSKSGHCGNDIDWRFDGRTLYLTNSASHKQVSARMPDYDLSKNIAPWIKQKLDVRKVVVGLGIGRIGSCAFANCESLNSVEFQDAFLWEIGWGAFLNCRSLFNISIPVNVKRIETIAFANCSSLRSVRIPNLARVEDQAFLSCTNLSLVEVGDNALLGKAVFATEVTEDGHTMHRYYTGEIRSLPANINTDNCTEYGLSKESVAICLKSNQPHQNSQGRLSNVDTNIPEARIMRNDTYALIIGSYPTAAMNLFLIGINIYHLVRLFRDRKEYDLIETEFYGFTQFEYLNGRLCTNEMVMDADWDTNPYAYQIEEREVSSDDTLRIRMAPGGGFAAEMKTKN